MNALVPLLLTDRRSTPSARADRQEPLPMFRCPGSPGFPSSPDQSARRCTFRACPPRVQATTFCNHLRSPRTSAANARAAAPGGAELQPRQHPTCQDTRHPLLLRPLLVRGTRLHAAGAQPCEGGHPVRATLTTWPLTTLATLAAVVAAPVALSLAELPMPNPQHVSTQPPHPLTAHRSPLTAHRSPSSRLACTGSSRGPGRPRACVRTASSRTPRPLAIAWHS